MKDFNPVFSVEMSKKRIKSISKPFTNLRSVTPTAAISNKNQDWMNYMSLQRDYTKTESNLEKDKLSKKRDFIRNLLGSFPLAESKNPFKVN